MRIGVLGSGMVGRAVRTGLIELGNSSFDVAVCR